jgi:hypothetical protein
MSELDAIKGEAMLLDWSETAKGGAKIVLALPSAADLEPFRMLTLAKRGVAGQRMAYAMVLIGDDEQPEALPAPAKVKGGALAKLAGIWCGEPAFQAWCREAFLCEWATAVDSGVVGESELAAEVMRKRCFVDSRAELDHSALAKAFFDDQFRRPYTAWLRGEGR